MEGPAGCAVDPCRRVMSSLAPHSAGWLCAPLSAAWPIAMDAVEAKVCIRKEWALPRFGQRFSGKRGPFTQAVAMVGTIDVQQPYDWHFGRDFFHATGERYPAGAHDRSLAGV